MNLEKRLIVTSDEFVFGTLSIVYFIFAFYFCQNTNVSIVNAEKWKYIFSVVSVIQLAIMLKSIIRMQKCFFSLYMVFFLFLYVFSFGQFTMWAFGVHYVSEMTVSHHVRFIDVDTVVRIQAVSLHLISVFHLGALISTRKYERRLQREIVRPNVIGILGTFALPMLIISGAINIYYTIICFKAAAVYGYSALFDQHMPPIIKYLSYMFIPSLYLTLITRNYDKRWFYFLTGVFGVYSIPLMITGDRGSWIYFLGPWLWCYIKKVNIHDGIVTSKQIRRRTITSVLLVFTVLFISSQFVSVRSVGYTAVTNDSFSFDDLYTPFIKPFFEMGQSARILGIIIQDDLFHIYPYGNTYIADILGMVWPTLKVLLGFPDMYVENWMSSTYLRMENYGVGFSAFAEAYLNGGLFFSWVYMLLFGYFIGGLITIRDEDTLKFPVKTFLALSAVTLLGPGVRATLDLWLREFFWGALFALLVAKAMDGLRR